VTVQQRTLSIVDAEAMTESDDDAEMKKHELHPCHCVLVLLGINNFSASTHHTVLFPMYPQHLSVHFSQSMSRVKSMNGIDLSGFGYSACG
jgi:hypothetical protein